MKLIDILHKANRRLAVNNSIWERLQMRRMARLTIKVLSNTLLPLTYKLCKPSGTDMRETIPVVVSLTSFPVRIGRIWIVIESILRQTVRPNRIILWLSREQFPNEEKDLPQNLLDQHCRGLDIRFVDGDIRSYKKFYYLIKEFQDILALTIDDDLLFPSYYLNNIYECYLRHPGKVIASFGFRYVWDDSFGYIKYIPQQIQPDESGHNLFLGTGGGTLFNTSWLKNIDELDVILDLCPTADDIYFNSLIKRNGLAITFYKNAPLLSITSENSSKLVDYNGDITDPDSVNGMQLKNIVNYCIDKFGCNPFKNEEK